jgi:TPR repeat protein
MGAPLRRAVCVALLATGAAQAQAPAPLPGAAPEPAADMRKLCAASPAAPTQPRAIAERAQCVLQGLVPSDNRFTDARQLARKAMELGEPAGGFLLFLAFTNDPAYRVHRDGKVDLEAYRRQGERPVAERRDQVEALEGLGFAAGKGHLGAGVLLANHFYETVAPRNVSRVRALVDLLARKGHRNPLLDKMGRESTTIEKTARGTQASVRSFLDAYRAATSAALAGHAVQTAGKCDQAELKSVSAGDIQGAEYLPLKGPMVADSYLVKGQWTEFWTFMACGEEVPVKVAFTADGWGGSSFSAAHNKGQ